MNDAIYDIPFRVKLKPYTKIYTVREATITTARFPQQRALAKLFSLQFSLVDFSSSSPFLITALHSIPYDPLHSTHSIQLDPFLSFPV